MKDNRKTRKLEFKKETIARLGEWQMKGVLGGTEGGNQSVQIEGTPCTVGGKTVGPKYTCNAVVCKTTTN